MPNTEPRTQFVPAKDLRVRRWLITLVLFGLFVAWWYVTSRLARDVRPWAITLANVCVAAGFFAGYAVPWAVAVIWAKASRRRMIFRMVGTTLLLIVLLLVMEIPAIVAAIDYSEVWSRATGDWDGPSTSYVHDWELGFIHPPHSKWFGQPRSDMAVYWNLPIRRAAPMSFTTDKRGFRNLSDRDEADIVLLGDSYIEGAYVSDDETCAAVLERKTGLKVMNLGLGGFGTLQELEVLRHHAIAMKPRLVAWFFFEGNDLYNDVDFAATLPLLRERLPYESKRWDWSWSDFHGRSLTRTAFRALRRVLDPVAPNSVNTCGFFRDKHGTSHKMYYYSYGMLDYDDYEKECFERTKGALRRGRDLCNQNRIPLVVFYIPMKFRVYGDLCTFPQGSPCAEWQPWDLVDYFREFCGEETIPFVDLTPPMRAAAAAGELLYAPEDSHWSVEGQAFVADRTGEQWQRYSALAP
jgi:hypothetical protein